MFTRLAINKEYSPEQGIEHTFCSECGMTLMLGEQAIVHSGLSTYTDKLAADNIRRTGFCSSGCMGSKYGTDMSPGSEGQDEGDIE